MARKSLSGKKLRELEEQIEPLPAPPEGFPPYKETPRCSRLNCHVRRKVERASHALVQQMKEDEKSITDAWFRSKIYGHENAPISILHEHYAGMGGRSIMGKGVGGFILGAACPSGGLCTLAAVTYDLPWFTTLLNLYLRYVQTTNLPDEVENIACDMPDVFTCWQLNFGRNESDQLSYQCFYNPHIDRNNAKVSSIGTSFGDYEGGGVWIADPAGDTVVHFEREVDGIFEGYVPGVVKTQKVKWISFWAATKVHAIPPFRKNRVGVVAFSSQTALRCTPEEFRCLDILQFKMPKSGDARFVPPLPEVLQVEKINLPQLSAEQFAVRSEAKKEYHKVFRLHKRECDKMIIANASECFEINRNRVQGVCKHLEDGSCEIQISSKASSLFLQNVEKHRERDIANIFDLADRCEKELLELEKKSDAFLENAQEDQIESLQLFWQHITQTVHKEVGGDSGTRHEPSDSELIDRFQKSAALSDTKDASGTAVPQREKMALFLTASKSDNTSRKDRKRMESQRWKWKNKYGTLEGLPEYQAQFPSRYSKPAAATGTSAAPQFGTTPLTPAMSSSETVTPTAGAAGRRKSIASTAGRRKSMASCKQESADQSSTITTPTSSQNGIEQAAAMMVAAQKRRAAKEGPACVIVSDDEDTAKEALKRARERADNIAEQQRRKKAKKNPNPVGAQDVLDELRYGKPFFPNEIVVLDMDEDDPK